MSVSLKIPSAQASFRAFIQNRPLKRFRRILTLYTGTAPGTIRPGLQPDLCAIFPSVCRRKEEESAIRRYPGVFNFKKLRVTAPSVAVLELLNVKLNRVCWAATSMKWAEPLAEDPLALVAKYMPVSK